MRHKHAEVMKIWVDDMTTQIQFYDKTKDDWIDCNGIGGPSWANEFEYRIKPEPKPDVVYYACFDEGDVLEKVRQLESCITISLHKALDSLKLTFDGETGKLKSAEVIS
jgi:hypothetical protein